MFFFLSKSVGVLLMPVNFVAAVGAVGLILAMTGWRRAGVRMAVTSLLLLIVFGLSPLGYDLGHALESRFPKWDADRGPPDGIVVLGGAISPDLSAMHREPVVDSDAGRVLAIAKLARAYPNARIIYSGGDGSLAGNRPEEAQYLYPVLDDFGIDRSRVTLEPRSRNTAENAAFSKEIALPKPGERWLLVTSAQHMPRAVGCFRQAGFAVEAFPVAWHTGLKYRFLPSLEVAQNLARLDSAAKEWIGLFAYWVSGKTSSLLPAP
jgi:uncharacterized SAM-binding protein YcdF (DUF218 family)